MSSTLLHHGANSVIPAFRRRVVITGMGAITPLGNTLETSWNNLFRSSEKSKVVEDNNNIGITTLEQAILAQNLPPAILNQELELIRTLPCQVAAPVRGIDHDPRTSRFVQLALHAGMEAAQNANLLEWLQINKNSSSSHSSNENDNNNNCHRSVDDVSPEIIQYRRERVGTSLGIGLSSVRDIFSTGSLPPIRLNRLSPHFVPKILPNSAPSRLSIALSLQGPNHAITTACAASSHAIIDAVRCIQMGDADIMLAGGFEACIDPLSMAGFCRLRALSTFYKYNPDTYHMETEQIKMSSRPFDSNRDGFVMGEGGAILVLEALEHALERIQKGGGGTILGEVIGYGTTGDAFHVTAPEKDGKGAERAIHMALQRAALSYSQRNDKDAVMEMKNRLEYVNAHATSTPLGDDIEARLLDRMFMQSNDNHSDLREHSFYVSSTKGATGHLLGAAGAVEAAYTVMALVDGKIPPTSNLNLNSDNHNSVGGEGDCIHNVGFQHVTEDMGILEKDIQVAMSTSLGFGGTNASLIFSKFNMDDAL